jgi:hypothetical protein
LSAATITPNAPQETEGKMKLDETPYFALIDEKELAKLLAHYGKTQNLPRVTGQVSDPQDENEQPIKVGKLLVAPKWLETINKGLVGLLQDNCRAAAYNKSSVLDDRGVGAVEERFCVLPPLPGILVVKRD